jgi:hypothetical protein
MSPRNFIDSCKSPTGKLLLFLIALVIVLILLGGRSERVPKATVLKSSVHR